MLKPRKCVFPVADFRVCILAFVLCLRVFSLPITLFETLGGDGGPGWNDDWGSDVIETSDGGYFVTGFGNYPIGNQQDLLYIKFDNAGLFSWAKAIRYDSDYQFVGMSGIETYDGSFVMTGYTYAGNFDILIVKVSSTGSFVWGRKIGNESVSDFAYSVIETCDGNYVITGCSRTYGVHGSNDLVLVKFSPSGSLVWFSRFGGGGTGSDVGKDVKELSDGKLVVAGYTASVGKGSTDALLCLFFANGTLDWAFTLGGSEGDSFSSVSLRSEGGFVAGGETGYGSGDKDLLVATFSMDGTFEWARNFGASAGSDYVGTVVQAEDGGYFVYGTEDGNRAVFAKYTSDGTRSYSKKMGSDWTNGKKGSLTMTGGFVGTGRSSGYGPYFNDVFLTLLDKDGNGCGGYWSTWTPPSSGSCTGFVSSRWTNATSEYVDYSNVTSFVRTSADASSIPKISYCTKNYYSCFGVSSSDESNTCSGNNGFCVATDTCKCVVGFFGAICNVTSCFGVMTNESDVCSSTFNHGECTERDHCECDPGYYGERCNVTRCFGVLSNESDVVCYSHGVCKDLDDCACVSDYFSSYCNITTCHGSFTNETEVCSSHGICSTLNHCTCNDHYFGRFCNITTCNGVFNNDTTSSSVLCSGRGSCDEYNKCHCNDVDYFGLNCNVTTCHGSFTNETGICSSHGFCFSPDICECSSSDYFGELCNVTSCYGVLNNETNVCSTFGRCEWKDRCLCDSQYHGRYCNLTECYGILSNETGIVCSVHGVCLSPDHCSCVDGYFGRICNITQCNGVWNNETEVCMDRGTCPEEEKCICDTNYFGTNCNITKCGDFWNNDTENVCGMHGTCDFKERICNCSRNYTGDFCKEWNCFGINKDNKNSVCSGFGICVEPDQCECISEGYSGHSCEKWKCFNVSAEDVNEVCGGHGACIESNSCFCMFGYNSPYPEGPCTEWYCASERKDDSRACSGRGKCSSSNRCICRGGYEGELCESFSCGYPYTSPMTCNGKGKCVNPGECKCKRSYGGEMCNTFLATAAIAAPLSVVGAGGLCCLVLCLYICGWIVVCICGMFCSGAGVIVIKQNTKVKQFEKLKNFDILLKEQVLEDDTSVAHIKVRKELYKIDYDDITVKKMLGEGGSASVVFKALWENKVVAFKCFKTRLVCSSQDKFNEFEMEVQCLSSLKHPFVISFYGATMKPPRVGILMEYCEHGDLNEFLKNHRTYHLREYDQDEKIRMMFEVSLSMGYLHSRNIIHRDLKCENVLVNNLYETKLMDFGLSKIVERMSQVRTTKIGTNIYMAPEVINSTKGYNEKCDVFSYAMLVYITMTEEFIPYGSNEMMIELRVSSDENFRPDISVLDKILTEKNKWIRDVVVGNWKHSAKDRMSFKEIEQFFVGKNRCFQEMRTENERGDAGKKEDLSFLKKEDFGVLPSDVENYCSYLERQIVRVRTMVEN